MSVQRWRVNAVNWRYPDQTMLESGIGEWVRYDDHVAALAERATANCDEKRCAIAAAAQPRTLNADDPRPASGSVLLDNMGQAWQIVDGYLQLCGSTDPFNWRDAQRNNGPFTLIHDGGAA